MKLKEIMFVGEEDPEKGYTAQALGYSIFTEQGAPVLVLACMLDKIVT